MKVTTKNANQDLVESGTLQIFFIEKCIKCIASKLELLSTWREQKVIKNKWRKRDVDGYSIDEHQLYYI